MLRLRTVGDEQRAVRIFVELGPLAELVRVLERQRMNGDQCAKRVEIGFARVDEIQPERSYNKVCAENRRVLSPFSNCGARSDVCDTVRVIGELWFVLAMLAVVVLARGVGQRIGVPFSILLTLIGLLYAILPGPKLHLDPAIVLTVVLPPLLYSTARGSSLLSIRANLRPVVSLSVLLVLLTAFAVGALVTLVVPGMPVAVGLVLGPRSLRRTRWPRSRWGAAPVSRRG